MRGQFLKFTKGDWLYGSDDKELPIGTKLAVNMPMFRLGWKRWEIKQLTGDVMQLLIDRLPIPARSSLGDTDPEMWPERDEKTGEPRDPWVFVNEVPMMDSDDNLYTFSIQSKGGLNCMARLCGEYVKGGRMHPGQMPVVEIGKRFYEHAKWGRTANPTLEIVGWSTWNDEAVLAIGAGNGSDGPQSEVVEEDEIPFYANETPTERAKRDTLAANAGAKPTGYEAVMAEREAQAAAALQASATPKPVKRARF